MAENPAIWGPATEIIDAAINNAIKGMREGYTGYSMAIQVAKALQDAGYLKNESVWAADPL